MRCTVPSLVSRRRPWWQVAVVALAAVAVTGCVDRAAVRDPSPQQTAAGPLALGPEGQPDASLAPNAEDRVGPLLMPDPAGIKGMTLTNLDDLLVAGSA
jgi:hypothetical protein